MRSRSGDTCLGDMHTPWSMCRPRIVNLGCMVIEKLIKSPKLDIGKAICMSLFQQLICCKWDKNDYICPFWHNYSQPTCNCIYKHTMLFAKLSLWFWKTIFINNKNCRIYCIQEKHRFSFCCYQVDYDSPSATKWIMIFLHWNFKIFKNNYWEWRNIAIHW